MLRRFCAGMTFASDVPMRPRLEAASMSVWPSRVNRVVRDEQGAVAILFALSIVVLFGIVALAGDT
jgi:Flp pilus assembly protein TadG